jgi:hypothetical protein
LRTKSLTLEDDILSEVVPVDVFWIQTLGGYDNIVIMVTHGTLERYQLEGSLSNFSSLCLSWVCYKSAELVRDFEPLPQVLGYLLRLVI